MRPSPEFSTYFSDAPATHSPEVLAVAPGVEPSLALLEYGPGLVGGTMTLDDASCITKIGARRIFSRQYAVPAGPTLSSGKCYRLRAAGLPFVGVADLEPGDLLGVTRAPLMRLPVDALQHNRRVTGPSSGPPAVPQVSAVTDSPLTAAAKASPSPALLERLAPDQHASFLRVSTRLPSHP